MAATSGGGSFAAPHRREEVPTPQPAVPAPTWFAQNNVAPAPPVNPGLSWADATAQYRQTVPVATAPPSRGSGQPTNSTMPVPYPGGSPGPTSPASPAPSPAAPAVSGTRNAGDPLARIEQLQGQYPPTAAGFRQILAQLQREGYPVVAATHNGGADMSDDAVVLPNGEVYDIISSVGSPNASWSMAHTDNYDPSRSIVTPSGEFQSFSSYLQSAGLPASTAQPFARSGGGGAGVPTGNGGSGAGAVAPGNWQAGIDPSYGFDFSEGLRALQASAAAKGTLLTGGTLKGLMRYGIGAASREYGNVFDRNYRLASLGINATNNAANLGSSYSGQVGNQASNFGNELGNLTNNQAGNNANLTQGQLNNLVGLITGQGNVNAAGQVGGANSWAGTLAGLANIFGPAVIQNPK